MNVLQHRTANAKTWKLNISTAQNADRALQFQGGEF